MRNRPPHFTKRPSSPSTVHLQARIQQLATDFRLALNSADYVQGRLLAE